MIKQMAISYKISEISSSFYTEENLTINPAVVFLSENKKPETFQPPEPILMQKRSPKIDVIYREKNDFFGKISKTYRANQERIISDIICGIILRELRGEKDEEVKLIFFITYKFDTNKIVGRLAYLNLPMDRVTILFISRNIKDFYTRNIVSPFDDKVDLNYLNEKEAANNIFGPYPEDGSIGLLRTFYKTYNNEIFPVRIDLFCQNLENEEIIKIKKDINNEYLSIKNTEVEQMLGLKERDKTRMPKILCDCERYTEELDTEGKING